MKPKLVTCYVNPDLDGVAGAIAYADFLLKRGIACEAGIIGEPHDEAKYVFERFEFPSPTLIPNAEAYDEVILVDASDLNGLAGKIRPEQVIEIIDHRKTHEATAFPNAKAQIELVGAAATLIAEKFMAEELAISHMSATLLYGAILSNTLNFRATVTTERDKQAAAWLNARVQLPESFWKDLFLAKSNLSGIKLAERIEGDFAHFMMGGMHVGIAQLEIIGARKLVTERETEILEALSALKKAYALDHVFQNTIELEEVKNFFVTDEPETRELLEKVLTVRFSGNVAERPDILMRKQIVPLLKEALENQ